MLLRFWRHFTALGTCKPEETWKLPHQTCGHRSTAGLELRGNWHGAGGGLNPPTDSPRGAARPCLPLTVKAGSTGCVNLALKVWSSCLVLAL